MLRRVFWFAAALFPGMFLPLFGIWEPASWFAHAPLKVARWLLAYWWLPVLMLLALHWLCFSLAPLFNKKIAVVWKKTAWAVGNFLLWPLAPPLYLWFCTDRLREPA